MLSMPHIDSMLSIKEQVVRGQQGRLATFEAGQGDRFPVLFLHADAGSARQWKEMVLRVAAERRAVAFDFRGHGASEPAANHDYGYAGRAEDVSSVTDALGLQRCLLVAHSGGAAVGLHFAAEHPERVAGLLLVDPATDPRALPAAIREGMLRDLAGPRSLEVHQAYYASIAGDDPAVRERVLADCADVSAPARLGVTRALAEWNPEPSLHAWRGPSFILASSANDNGHALYDLRPDLAHRVVAGVGHWIALEKPELVEQTLRSFLFELEASEG
jgi:pimeloyl-ACP methyl ester carboxylesterase